MDINLLGSRAFTMYHGLGYLHSQKSNNAVLVETGCCRLENNFVGDGMSTIIFGQFANEYNAYLYTCDIDQNNLNKCKEITKQYSDRITYVCSDSVKFLQEFDKPIDLLYLDSMDFITSGDPIPPQEHAIKEYMAAKDKLHDNSVILIDDCFLIHGGKGGKIIPVLLAEGWWIYASFYQTMLVRMSSIKA